jgi:hypothetical protein
MVMREEKVSRPRSETRASADNNAGHPASTAGSEHESKLGLSERQTKQESAKAIADSVRESKLGWRER